MFRIFRSHPVAASTASLTVLAGLAWLAFGYFGIQAAFLDNEVSEAAPTFDAPAPAASGEDIELTAASANETASSASDDTNSVDQPATDELVAEPAAEPAAAAAEPAITTEYSGTFAGANDYDVVGDVQVLGNGTGQRFLRFENFSSDNGPDLDVYLVNSSSEEFDFINLGELKGNVGDQNYELTADIDLDQYDQVFIWCTRFGAHFGTADLVPSA